MEQKKKNFIGDFEVAIVTDLMPKLNPKDYNLY